MAPPPSFHIYEIEKESLYGGITLGFKFSNFNISSFNNKKKIKGYDINSSYAYAMECEMPIKQLKPVIFFNPPILSILDL